MSSSRITLFFATVLFVSGLSIEAQAQQQREGTMESLHEGTAGADRRAAALRRNALFLNSPVAEVPAENIGPTIMSGRVSDIDAWAADPSHFFVAYASGGLWKTENNGHSFEPLFDDQGAMSIGDIAVDWKRDIIWVGTGENNSSRSSYSGDGIYKSTDGGESWEHMGLPDMQHTGRIILHPDDPNTIWVASMGPLYSYNQERGVYKTTDGGQTWNRTLFVDEKTGAIDLIMEPGNPEVFYAAMWERDRRAWNFVESGPGSGMYKSTDGGETWTKISGGNSGFPDGPGVGRIGIDVSPIDPNILYAALDNQERTPDDEEEEDVDGLTRNQLRSMSRGAFLALSDEEIGDYLERENFPNRYDTETVRSMVEDGDIEPVALVEFVEDANSLLFNGNVKELEVYRSDDGGMTWGKTHDEPLGGVYNTYGYYFGEVRMAPDNPDQVYAMGVPILRSDDGGETWKSIGAGGVHADHQAMWLNPNRPGHFINGNDGGLNMSYDAGENWNKLNIPPVGQFYAIQVDNAEPYNVYGGLQDNGTWYGPSTYNFNPGWVGNGEYPYDRLGGGDGMQVEVDTRTNDVVYYGSQFGFYSRVNTSTGQRAAVRPRQQLGERPLRFNWQTPIHLSRHNQDILYYGANKLYRSMTRGEDLQAISPDLTGGGQPGDVPYGTLTTIDESPLKFGLIYTGSDDGYVYVTRDAGSEWTRIDGNLPDNLWVSRVEASSHEEGRVYVSLNGYRWDHFDSYVYRSDNYGATWTRIGTDLPAEPVNVVLEDPVNEDIVYVGTDHASYVSFDRGRTFHGFGAGIPFAPVHDMKIQQRENDLLIGTHGRSIFRADLDLVQQLTPALMAENVHMFDIGDVNWSGSWGTAFRAYSDPFEPSTELVVWSGGAGAATVMVSDADGEEVASFATNVRRGLNYLEYDLTITEDAAERINEMREDEEDAEMLEEADNGKFYIPEGEYTITMSVGGNEGSATLNVVVPRRGNFSGEPEPYPFMRPAPEYRIK